ncbi:uncharacterized protein BP5553_02212 [Venustampulla echinocandica]|uniref:FAD-binding PCMH-type domain-containing protein n=1 Tax=Venustampulla echinocandica TaxID=2656787 RepID=A0A370U3C3_9HELO|nr:uncharacterized protein BP5553_02212 [Venustampulla echinocandica]RDL42233.1 hypothetical protein BP5553_02212 [Venustampulla echinocandica]
MQPWFQNGTCDPFRPQSTPCTLGNLVQYSINVSSAADVVAGLKFGREKNVRLAIKNTGHEFSGKNTAKGGLGLWTHNLNKIEINTNYSRPSYKGPAMKMGAGTLAASAYQAAHALGYRVIGGSCPTVGLAGGYTQGGGHSVLSSIYGLGADNVLEWEVVTADGRQLIASPEQNADLFWALSGGGPATYAVVISMTTRMYLDGPTSGASLTFSSSGIDQATYWAAIENFQSNLAPLVDAGAVVLYTITPSNFLMFASAPAIAASTFDTGFASVKSHLTQVGIAHNLTVTADLTYYDHFQRYYGPLPNGIWEVSHLIGSRLIPRSVVTAPAGNKALVDAYANITASGDFIVVSIAMNASRPATLPGGNSVHPAWRSALLHTLAYWPWDWTASPATITARERTLTEDIEPQLVQLSPGSGTYLNEANFNMKNAQQEFYGPNLARLRSLKKKWDKQGLLWARTAIGSEAWVEDGTQRLCKSGKDF